MRGCLGVLAGLIIGAAISFALLVVGVYAAKDEGTCAATAPAGWLIQVVVPWEEIQSQVASTAIPAGGGLLSVDRVAPGSCGRLQVRATWEGLGTSVRGFGLVLEGSPGARELRPVALLLGRLQVPLDWVPSAWLKGPATPITQAGGAALARGLRGDDTELCGLVGLEKGLALFLCTADR